MNYFYKRERSPKKFNLLILFALLAMPFTSFSNEMISDIQYSEQEQAIQSDLGSSCIIGYYNVSECDANDGFATVLPSSPSGVYCWHFGSWWQRFFCYLQWYLSERTYEWSNGETTQSISNLAPGDYCVSVTDSWTGIVSDCCVTIEGPSNCCADLVIDVTGTDPTCDAALLDGQITASVSGGNGSYQYTLNPGGVASTDGTFNGLAPGIYTVDVAEMGSGCTVTTSEEIELLTKVCPGSWEECLPGFSFNLEPLIAGYSYYLYIIEPGFASCTGDAYEVIDPDVDGIFTLDTGGEDIADICQAISDGFAFPWPLSDEEANDPDFLPCFCENPQLIFELCDPNPDIIGLNQVENIRLAQEITRKSKRIQNNNFASIQNNGSTNKSFVSPNPFTNSFTVNIDAEIAQNGKIEVFDMVGKVVSSSNIAIGETQKNIDLSNQANGFYLIRMTVNGKIIKSEKLVKSW